MGDKVFILPGEHRGASEKETHELFFHRRKAFLVGNERRAEHFRKEGWYMQRHGGERTWEQAPVQLEPRA